MPTPLRQEEPEHQSPMALGMNMVSVDRYGADGIDSNRKAEAAADRPQTSGRAGGARISPKGGAHGKRDDVVKI